MPALDPVVHAALVALAAYFVQWLFTSIGLDLGSETYQAIAQVIVAYVLSIFGLGLYYKATGKRLGLLDGERYQPPFTG
jgi:hypothetical protein